MCGRASISQVADAHRPPRAAVWARQSLVPGAAQPMPKSRRTRCPPAKLYELLGTASTTGRLLLAPAADAFTGYRHRRQRVTRTTAADLGISFGANTHQIAHLSLRQTGLAGNRSHSLTAHTHCVQSLSRRDPVPLATLLALGLDLLNPLGHPLVYLLQVCRLH